MHILSITTRPTNWAGEDILVDAAELPPGTEINSNGAGDAFTSGLLVAAMLRNTGICMQYGSPVKTNGKGLDNVAESIDPLINCVDSPSKKLTGYSLYIRENYVALKVQCSDDKREVFEKCNEMWEEESEETKQMYERKASEEMANSQDESLEKIDTSVGSPSAASLQSPRMTRNLNLINQPMNLETAAQFASLVAAKHIDTSTRDSDYLNINNIREQSSVSTHGLEEI